MKTIIPYYPIGSIFRISVFEKDVVIAVREFDEKEGGTLCSQCCFRKQIYDQHFSGQITSAGFCCSLSLNSETFCNAKSRLDNKNVVYKICVKKSTR